MQVQPSKPSDSTLLGDFTMDARVYAISALAIAIGAIASISALILFRLIAFFTNSFYFGRFSTETSSPANNHLGWLALFVPVVGAMIVGVMARYGSELIRGHGIPEAIESILLEGSRIEPRVALLKPLSAAISIGSGGPFGAEGPIIMTGGACGSIVAQMFRLTSAERKTLLVAGAAAGMSATFAAPVSSVLLGVELLLFELKPRSLVPVALASGTAGLIRPFLLAQGPLFPADMHPPFVPPWALICCGLFGVVAGLVAIPLSNSVYAFEDLFRRLPIHWMWWPPIGGLAVGLGGLLFPQALGVGYDVIGQLVRGDRSLRLVLGILIVKWLIWAIALGSGTSGGVFAPVMMIGGALGSLLSFGLPHLGPGFWAVLGLGATMSATLRAPITAIVFTVEVTHDWNMLLPLLIGCTASYAVSVLYLRRSILTRKVARRGYPLSAEYEVDPLDLLYVHEVMLSTFASLPSDGALSDAKLPLRTAFERSQKLLPVLNAEGILQGIVRRSDLAQHQDEVERNVSLAEILQPVKARAYPDESLQAVVDRMAEQEVTSMPVVDPQSDNVLGVISLEGMLRARARHLEEERNRQQVLHWRLLNSPRTRKSIKR